jgi:hypothetical protein
MAIERNPVRLEKRQHAIVQEIGRRDRRLLRVELAKPTFE